MSKRILVIDDEDSIRTLVQFSLEAATSWEVLTAAGGGEGIEKAITQQPDAILLDVMMPIMDGVETFRHLQANSETQQIPIIFLTAKANPVEHQQLLDIGVLGLIVKPFKAQELVTQLYSMLNWDRSVS